MQQELFRTLLTQKTSAIDIGIVHVILEYITRAHAAENQPKL